jgi:hypothetical protein
VASFILPIEEIEIGEEMETKRQTGRDREGKIRKTEKRAMYCTYI